MYKTLLPSNASKIERALEKTTNYTEDLAVLIKEVSMADQCPPHFLPFLAWMLSISDEEGWKFAESLEARRNLIKRSIAIHQKKGTVWSIREIFRMLGLGEIEIIENLGRLQHNGQKLHNGKMLHGGDPSTIWATYSVRLFSPITNDQAVTIRRILDGVAPARSELIHLDYSEVAIRHNGLVKHDGIYSRGTA